MCNKYMYVRNEQMCSRLHHDVEKRHEMPSGKNRIILSTFERVSLVTCEVTRALGQGAGLDTW